MEYIKKNLKRFIPTVLLVIGIVIAFSTFIQDNTLRIAKQNEEYLNELTMQRAISIDSLISENLETIKSVAYLYGKNLNSREADVEMIGEYEDNFMFNRLRFVAANGDNYTSEGMKANLADRDYFQAGMRGETGITFVAQSRVTGERQVGFYTPVYYEDEIIGVMVGFYGEDYVSRLLEYELFGYEGEGWLCKSDGTVVGATNCNDHISIMDHMGEEGRCAPEELAKIENAIATGEKTAFTYYEDDIEATGYIVDLQQIDWVLIRTFPPSASAQILHNANQEGVRLIIVLVALFAAYSIALVIGFLYDSWKMREANRNANYVSTGVARLFERFIVVDLNEEEYSYIGDVPDIEGLPSDGKYDQFYNAFINLITEDAHKEEAEELIKIDNLKKNLKDADSVSIRVHAPIKDDEWFTYNFIVISRDDDIPDRILIICQDVTQLHAREYEEQTRLQQALETAEKASRAKTEFLFNMSHDLRTPMNAIIGYTKLAQHDDVTEDDMRDYIRKIDSSGLHLLSLINDILEMSRIESGKMTLEEETTDLEQVIKEAKELFQHQMDDKKINFNVDYSGISERLVSCDKKRLNRIILNLLSNACKFTEEGGNVSLTMKQTGKSEDIGEYELRVKDDGIGMSPEFSSKLFMPFERERTSTVSGIQGTGLGLSITKNIIDMMDGTIDVETEQGVGTEFIVRLSFPLAKGEDSTEIEGLSGDKTVDFTGKRLLVVEDNDINREIESMILTNAGFVLEIAENGQIAVDMVSASNPGYYDAVLMDIQMPVMDGYTAARTIRALDNKELASIPIIAMTANAFAEDRQDAAESGMNGHIAKPFDIPKMMETLAQVLSSF